MGSGFGLKSPVWLYRQPWLRFLLSRSTKREIEKSLLTQIKLRYKELNLSLLADPRNIGSYFSEDVCRKSFSGSVIADVCELDYYYLITSGEEVVGFFRAVDLYFDAAIELHGSYGYKNPSHMRSYFILSKMFIREVLNTFPDRKITSVANRNNKNAMHYIKWLGFVEVGDNNDATDMVNFELDNSSYNDMAF